MASWNRLRSIPGVQSAALTEIVPLSQDDMDRGPFVIREKPGSDVKPSADYRDISPGYFETMRIPLLQGRSFAESDDAKHPRVVVIDQTLAREYFGTENPLGKHVVLPYGSPIPREIIGVVGAVRDSSLSGAPEATIYFPYMQGPDQTMSMVVRTALPRGHDSSRNSQCDLVGGPESACIRNQVHAGNHGECYLGSPGCLYSARHSGSGGPCSGGDWNLRRDLV